MIRVREEVREVGSRFGSASDGKGLLHTLISAAKGSEKRRIAEWLRGLLIRRSWVRDPPGSLSKNLLHLHGHSPSASVNKSVTTGVSSPCRTPFATPPRIISWLAGQVFGSPRRLPRNVWKYEGRDLTPLQFAEAVREFNAESVFRKAVLLGVIR